MLWWRADVWLMWTIACVEKDLDLLKQMTDGRLFVYWTPFKGKAITEKTLFVFSARFPSDSGLHPGTDREPFVYNRRKNKNQNVVWIKNAQGYRAMKQMKTFVMEHKWSEMDKRSKRIWKQHRHRQSLWLYFLQTKWLHIKMLSVPSEHLFNISFISHRNHWH